jgi:hypothetical protein
MIWDVVKNAIHLQKLEECLTLPKKTGTVLHSTETKDQFGNTGAKNARLIT